MKRLSAMNLSLLVFVALVRPLMANLAEAQTADLSNDLRRLEYDHPVKSSNEVPDHPFVQSNTPISLTEQTVSGSLLYDQIIGFNESFIGVPSQDYEAEYDDFDSELADDFTVPPDVSWEVTSIVILAFRLEEFPPVKTFNIFIYEDDGGKPNVDGPGRLRYIKANATRDDSIGSYTIVFGPTPSLRSGKTYWIAVQAAADFATYGDFYWGVTYPQTGSPAQWRNPGGGYGIFGLGCNSTSFGARGSECGNYLDYPDQLFRLFGNEMPESTPEPTPQLSPEPAPQPTPDPTPQPTPKTTPQPTPVPTPEPTTEMSMSFDFSTRELMQFADDEAVFSRTYIRRG